MTRTACREHWVRLEDRGTGIYVRPERPDWCVPNARADFILSRLLDGQSSEQVAHRYAQQFDVPPTQALMQVIRLADRLDWDEAEPYAGRAEHLSLDSLRECWLHVTNRCNARCAHCMFSCSPAAAPEMDTETAISLIDQARELGCELFYFTGGEPLVHPDLLSLCEHILKSTTAHLVLLTNAVGIEKFMTGMRSWPRQRVHFQVSVDGTGKNHDTLRGRGAFRHLRHNLSVIRDAGFPVTLAMAVHSGNVEDMPRVVEFAGEQDVRNLHYLWLFTRGKATSELFVEPERIADRLIRAAALAEEHGVSIDNLEILKSQVFSLPGSRFDLTNAGWDSLAVGPEGRVFPSPALVGLQQVACGHADGGLEKVWRDSPTLQELRSASLVHDDAYAANPLRYLVGGGDIDHSLSNGGSFTGHDPYVPLYNRMALWLMAREARAFPDYDRPGFRLRMGDYLHSCRASGDGVFVTHSNCVLSLPGRDGHTLARDFYVQAAERPNVEIANPVGYDEDELAFVPRESRVRSYGCGSPVGDAGLSAGETVVDLGCGAGLECFIASALVGRDGRVVGVDMLPEMLRRAENAAGKVAARLGYRNVEFHRGTLEDLPLPGGRVDVGVSNCVINLCEHKRRVFQEIHRILKPGGRLVISDVVSDEEIPLEIRYNERLRGECLGGAFRQDRLFQTLSDLNFRQVRVLRRFPYRQVRGHQFYSVTYSAVKPVPESRKTVLYPGPFAAALTDDGQLIARGESISIPWSNGEADDEKVLLPDAAGRVASAEAGEMECGCCAPQTPAPVSSCCAPAQDEKLQTDCMVCGETLRYLEREEQRSCYYCGRTKPANAECECGHFVCDTCHSEDALPVIESVCLASRETDMVALLDRIRRHQSVPMHGPEHHALVPAVIVTAYRNAGGDVTDGQIRAAIQRGASMAGGSCAFLGICGAAAGVGTGFALILGSNPLKGRERQLVQKATAETLDRVAGLRAPRCCQRDCWIALRAAADLSRQLLPVPLEARGRLKCRQTEENSECIRAACPLWPG